LLFAAARIIVKTDDPEERASKSPSVTENQDKPISEPPVKRKRGSKKAKAAMSTDSEQLTESVEDTAGECHALFPSI
jgi:hypothetical protein